MKDHQSEQHLLVPVQHSAGSVPILVLLSGGKRQSPSAEHGEGQRVIQQVDLNELLEVQNVYVGY